MVLSERAFALGADGSRAWQRQASADSASTRGAAEGLRFIAGRGAPGTLNTAVTLSGDALLQFGSGAITAIGSSGNLALSGAQVQVADSGGGAALQNLSIASGGQLFVGGGASVAVGGGLTNSGTVTINNAGSSLSVGGRDASTRGGCSSTANFIRARPGFLPGSWQRWHLPRPEA
jgi:hypothetical protein